MSSSFFFMLECENLFVIYLPPTTLATKCFCIIKKTIITGAVAIKIAAINPPYSTKYADDKEFNTNVNAFCSLLCNTSNGHQKLFH